MTDRVYHFGRGGAALVHEGEDRRCRSRPFGRPPSQPLGPGGRHGADRLTPGHEVGVALDSLLAVVGPGGVDEGVLTFAKSSDNSSAPLLLYLWIHFLSSFVPKIAAYAWSPESAITTCNLTPTRLLLARITAENALVLVRSFSFRSLATRSV